MRGRASLPASLCGVWGLKPTFGRLSRRGTYPFVHSLDHLGPLADSVETLTLGYDAMQGPDPLDPGCHALRVQPGTPRPARGAKGLRIGVLAGYFQDFATAPARAVAELAARTLGATPQVHWPDAGIGRAAAFIITASEGGSLHLEDLRKRPQDFEALSVDRFLSGLLQPADWYLRAQRSRRIYRERVNALFADWDVLIAPATPVAAPAIGTEWLDINGTRHPSRAAMGLLTQPISFAGGMPIGVQLVAAPWNEELCLRAARVLQDAGVAGLKQGTP